ncbi:MAG: hypothetical protein AAFY66_01235 [Pseudomonadota bacterium]
MKNDMVTLYRSWRELRERLKLIDDGRSDEDVDVLLAAEWEVMGCISAKTPESTEEALCHAEVLWRLTKDYVSDGLSEDIFERLREGLAKMSFGEVPRAVGC